MLFHTVIFRVNGNFKVECYIRSKLYIHQNYLKVVHVIIIDQWNLTFP